MSSKHQPSLYAALRFPPLCYLLTAVLIMPQSPFLWAADVFVVVVHCALTQPFTGLTL